MKYYITTDTHFGHAMLVNHGYREEGFETKILSQLSKVDGDVLLHLGDFCIGNDELWHTKFMETVNPHFKKKSLFEEITTIKVTHGTTHMVGILCVKPCDSVSKEKNFYSVTCPSLQKIVSTQRI